jgi:hypothetical protein
MPYSCPLSLWTLIIEIGSISVGLLLLIYLAKVRSTPKAELKCFPVTAIGLLLFGSSVQVINTYFYYLFDSQPDVRPPTYQILMKATTQLVSGTQYLVLIWLTAEYTYLAVTLYYGRQFREIYQPHEVQFLLH